MTRVGEREAGTVSGEAFDRLVEAVHDRGLALPDAECGSHVASELVAVNRALARIQSEGLADGVLFCDWGSGLGGVCGVAALNGLLPLGIEIQRQLVDSARALASDLDLPLRFAEGTYLLPGDEDLVGEATHTHLVFDGAAWKELGLAPRDCSLIFAYPWPGEEALVDRVFARHASPGALLVTFHDWNHVLVQRKLADQEELLCLGWM